MSLRGGIRVLFSIEGILVFSLLLLLLGGCSRLYIFSLLPFIVRHSSVWQYETLAPLFLSFHLIVDL